eukprot:507835-Prymnesium_polylepis.1
MREAAPTHYTQPAPEGRINHQNRSIEAWLYATQGRVRVCYAWQQALERSGVHRCARRTSPQR